MVQKKYNFIYKITNLFNGKEYIGAHGTDNINDRYLGSGKLLKRDIKKYGNSNFERKILEYYNESITYPPKLEFIWINKYNTLIPNGYNISPTGGGYVLHTDETRENLSKLSMGNTSAKAHKGRTLSKEHRKNIKKSVLKNPPILKGSVRTKETKTKIADALKGKPSGMKGKIPSEIHRKNLSESLKKYYINKKIKDIMEYTLLEM